MTFDDEVDAAKAALAEERSGATRRARVASLEALRHTLLARIASRRLEFTVEDGATSDDEPSVLVTHAASGEELGAVFFDEDGYSFESEDDDYFPDIAAIMDVTAFAERLYQVLKIGVPAFELDAESSADA